MGMWVCGYVEVDIMIDGWFVRRIPRHLYRRHTVVLTSPPYITQTRTASIAARYNALLRRCAGP